MQPTVIITGASTGLGREMAFVYAQKGYSLGLTARRLELLESLKKEIEIQFPGTKIFIAACDVQNLPQVAPVIQGLFHELEQVDIFIANAGIGASTPAWEDHTEKTLSILATNVMGCVASLEAAKNIMLKQGCGHLVGVSSVASFRGLPASSAYSSSKAALTTYLESIRCDLKHHGIHVTSIHPGYVHTPMTAKNKHMPLVIGARDAAERMVRAIEKKKARFVFPWPLQILTKVIQILPDWLYDFLISLKYRNGVFR
ncbi:MAG TPA: hypothetical protein DDW49_06465 [Deltaproteobacteria bacterium]|nr:MAG: hypothetical protein A2048_02250 [Deltaproteobacteria bacterium GWA2_45_12]HBF13016.1 hypothetical protein [Deltaproteobacteria bacterium]